MIPAWLAANAARIAIYTGLGALVIAFAFLAGYSRDELKLFDYQAKEATARVAIVTKTLTIIREVENAADAGLIADNARLRILYDAAKRAPSLSAALGNPLACKPNNSPVPPDAGRSTLYNGVPIANRVLDDLEGAVHSILAAGDTEIAKFRRLAERDNALAKKIR